MLKEASPYLPWVSTNSSWHIEYGNIFTTFRFSTFQPWLLRIFNTVDQINLETLASCRCCVMHMWAGQLVVLVTALGNAFDGPPKSSNFLVKSAQLSSASLLDSKLRSHFEADWPLVVDRVLTQSQASWKQAQGSHSVWSWIHVPSFTSLIIN